MYLTIKQQPKLSKDELDLYKPENINLKVIAL